MNSVKVESVHHGTPSIAAPNGPPAPAPQKPRQSIVGKILLFLLLAGVLGGGYYAYSVGFDRIQRDLSRVIHSGGHSESQVDENSSASKSTERTPYPRWDGLVKLDPVDAKNSGLLLVAVRPQVDPIRLELPGRTAYDPNSLNKIRPRFDTLVEKVYAELGQKVKKGAPLVDLFSTDLAAAKNDFQTAYVQHQHDLTLRELREELFKKDVISKQLLTDTRNDENKSRLAYLTAKSEARGFRGS